MVVIGVPPNALAIFSVKALACGINVGIRSPSLHRTLAKGQYHGRFSRMRSEASMVCITRKIRVWRAKPTGLLMRRNCTGCRSATPSQSKMRVQPGLPPTSKVVISPMASEPLG